MTEAAIERLNKIERPTDNPTEAENEMNHSQKIDNQTYLAFRDGEVTREEYQIVKLAIKCQLPILVLLREAERLNGLES